jgi:hypothetical protein
MGPLNLISLTSAFPQTTSPCLGSNLLLPLFPPFSPSRRRTSRATQDMVKRINALIATVVSYVIEKERKKFMSVF